VDYDEYATRFAAHGRIAELRSVASLVEGKDTYDLLYAEIPGARTLTITAGFHGDEVAGPLTLLEHLPDIVAHARARDVGLRIYPCLNPSGFHDGTRYNRSREAPNNDLLRYELAPGQWVGELKNGQPFLRAVPHQHGPKETRALVAELERATPPHAALDLHQDPWLEGAFSYFYVFGAREAYLPLVAATEPVVPLARAAVVDDDDDVRSDPDGLIVLHDGSVTDYFFRRGVPFTAALETTTRTPLPRAHEVNLIWIRGFIDLAAGS
jgi:succinylglutamate desuccinylase/aspartoacylase family protein